MVYGGIAMWLYSPSVVLDGALCTLVPTPEIWKWVDFFSWGGVLSGSPTPKHTQPVSSRTHWFVMANWVLALANRCCTQRSWGACGACAFPAEVLPTALSLRDYLTVTLQQRAPISRARLSKERWQGGRRQEPQQHTKPGPAKSTSVSNQA